MTLKKIACCVMMSLVPAVGFSESLYNLSVNRSQECYDLNQKATSFGPSFGDKWANVTAYKKCMIGANGLLVGFSDDFQRLAEYGDVAYEGVVLCSQENTNRNPVGIYFKLTQGYEHPELQLYMYGYYSGLGRENLFIDDKEESIDISLMSTYKLKLKSEYIVLNDDLSAVNVSNELNFYLEGLPEDTYELQNMDFDEYQPIVNATLKTYEARADGNKIIKDSEVIELECDRGAYENLENLKNLKRLIIENLNDNL